MVRVIAFDRPKSISELPINARILLWRLSKQEETVSRLTGDPLQLIGRELATYNFTARGYELQITKFGAELIKPKIEVLTAPKSTPTAAKAPARKPYMRKTSVAKNHTYRGQRGR